MKRKAKVSGSDTLQQAPAITPEGREAQMIGYAVDLAEEQLRNGTASSQVITHYLKLGSIRERMERKKLEEEIKMLEAKTEAIRAEKDREGLYNQVLEAIKSYTPHGADVL